MRSFVKMKWKHAIKPSDNAKMRKSFSCVFNRKILLFPMRSFVKMKWKHAIKPSDNAKMRKSFSCVFNRPSHDKIYEEAYNNIPMTKIVDVLFWSIFKATIKIIIE
jgi:hypothetical protein